MNLFYLDKDHELNAQYHIDKHVSKMVLETAEMLSMAHWVDEVLGFVPRKLEVEEYQADKTTFASWKGREKPYWWDDAFAKNHQLRN